MTPLELQLEGFTVYRQHTTVDWQGADTALFAVTGPTGAGKSTLLDAITYVLYGKTARLGGKGLSGLISPGADSLFAQLTFRTARGVYRATRVAQRKASGAATEVRIEVADQQVAGGWRQLAESDKVKEANQALEEIVGLDYDGFTRAVLLPQGAFDEFLRGDAGLRRQLLASLLGLDRVEAIQRLASTRAAQLKGEGDARRTLLSTEYGDVSQDAIASGEEELAELERFVAAESQATSQLEATLREWRESARLLSEKVQLGERRARLTAAGPALAEVKRKAELGRRAAAVAPQVAQTVQAEERVTAARKATAERTAELEAAKQAFGKARTDSEAARVGAQRRIAELTAETGALDGALPMEAVLSAYGGTREMAAGAGRAEALDPHAWNAWATALSLVPGFERAVAARAAAEEALAAAREGAARLEAVVAAARTDLEARTEPGKRLRERAALAEEELERVRRADLAAAVRAGLEPGEPCPVCGAPIGAHEPAGHAPDLAAAESARDAAKAELETARAEYEVARTALARQEADLTHAQLRCEETEKSLTAAVAALDESVRELQGHGVVPAEDGDEQEPEGGSRYGQHSGRKLKNELRDKQEAALAAHASALEARLAEAHVVAPLGEPLSRLLQERQEELEAARATLLGVDEGLAEAGREAEAAAARLGLATENQALFEADLVRAQEALAAALDGSGFLDVAAVTEAALAPQELQSMEAQVQAHEQEVAQLDRRDVELAAALAARPPLPDAPRTLEAQLVHATHRTEEGEAELVGRRHALVEAQQQVGASRGRLQQAKERLKRSVALRRELTELDAKHALHHQLNTDLHGHRFPEHLLTQVQQVLARRASAILQLVTDGRYDLRLEAGDYLVADAWAGGELRSARTLSGGESFVASLALALALSDTLAGSAALGALFLDEGFGTLDRATLEAVTSVLESLTSEGRMVGVITHVPELSARLPARLVVTKEPGGSTVVWDT